MSWSLERAFCIGIGLAAAGLVAIAVVQYQAIPNLRDAEREVDHASRILDEVSDVMASADDAASMASAFVFQGRIEYKRLQGLAVDQTLQHERHLRSLASTDGRLNRSLDGLSTLIHQRLAQLDQLMWIAGTQGVDGALRFISGGEPGRLRESLRRAGREMIDTERDMLRLTRESSERSWRRVETLMGCGLLVSIASLAVSVLLVFRGARRQKAIERELLKERYLLQTLLEHVPMGVFFKDPERRFTRTSRALAKLLGVDAPAQLQGRRFEDFLPEEQARHQRIQDMEVLRSGRAVVGEEQHLAWDGKPEVWLFTSTVPLYDDGNGLMGLLGVTMDITERKTAEMAQEDAAARLTEWVGKLEERNDREKLLADMNELLQTCGSESEAGEVIGRYLPALYPAASGHLSLTKPSRNVVESVAIWGEQGGQSLVFAPNQCWALRRGRPHRAGLHRLEPMCEHGCGKSGVHSYCVPMMAHGESIGVFNLASADTEFGEDQYQLAVVAAERIGLALANLRLRDALRVLSIRDPLTGLFNRRYLEESCEREFRRAARHERPLAVVMGDLDQFKRFNDTFGHEAGDALLREFGGLLLSHTRKEDIACRYGGEEFLLLLPELSAEAACVCADKLRQAVAHLAVNVNGQAVGQVTVSFGVAAFPEHGDSAAALIRAADNALYIAKKLGRNRVAIAPAPAIDALLVS